MRMIFLAAVQLGALMILMPGSALPFCFEEAGSAYSLPPRLLESIATVESGLNPAALNHNRNGSTDFGLMQVNSSWIGPARLDRERLVRDPCYNTRAGARILRGCIDRHGYTWEAVGCYNAASDHKRREYAWKVFRQLAASEKGSRQAAPSLTPPGTMASVTERKSSSMTVSFDERETGGRWSPDGE